MKDICFDKLYYNGYRIAGRGWACPEKADCGIFVRLYDEKGKQISAEVQYSPRPDVAELKHGTCSGENMGFYFRFIPEGLNKVTAVFICDADPEDRKEYIIDTEELARKYRKEKQNPRRLLAYLKSKDKEKFKETELSDLLEADEIYYKDWFEQHRVKSEELEEQKKKVFAESPLISVSIDGKTENKAQIRRLQDAVAAQSYSRITENETGDWTLHISPSGFPEPDALYRMICYLNEHPDTEMIYTDEDSFDEVNELHTDPVFKPDYSPVLLEQLNYIGSMYLVKNGISHSPERVGHIPRILYSEVGKKSAEPVSSKKTYPEEEPPVSVLIPNKDQGETLKKCVMSLIRKTNYRNLEILIVENNSREEETEQVYEELTAADRRVRVEVWPDEFNYAAINNFAAEKADGEYLLLLNNDTEVISPDFLKDMVMYAQRPNTGAVGAKLLYPDNTIQHAGVVVQRKGTAHHLYLGERAEEKGYLKRLVTSCNVSAVTGACLLIRKELYVSLGGMDKQFKIAYNDIDLCLKIREKGLNIIYDADAVLYHDESKTRGYDDTEEKKKRLRQEAELLDAKWQEKMESDPFYNMNFDIYKGSCRY